VDGVQDVEALATRLRKACSLPELLAVSFEAFQAIRVLARRSEDTVPWLFAAFMMAADAAVDGREAIAIAPSLSPSPGGTLATSSPAADADIDTITDALAALGALLGERLADAADRAVMPGDRAGCREAAEAGRRIHQLMARDDDDRDLW
jgi:hypothetical protein